MKLVAWDFDGVLNRGFQGDYFAWQEGFRADIGADPERFTDFVWGQDRFDAVLTGRYDLLDLLEEWRAAHGVTLPARHVLDWWLARDCVLDDQVTAWASACPLPGVIATNNDHHRAGFIWQSLGAHRFQRIFASGPLGVKKPDPGFYAEIEAWSGLDPADILLVDDAKKNIDAALARGWQVFHFTAETRAHLPEVLGIKA